MDIETARIVLAVIVAVEAVVWIAGLQFVIASARMNVGEQPAEDGDAGIVSERREGWLTGEAEVSGEPGTLASRAAVILAKGTLFATGPVRILEKTDERIRFERGGDVIANQAAGGWFLRGELRFTSLAPGRTRVEWAVEPARMRGLLWGASVFLAVGLVVLIVGGWAIYAFIASSPDPVVRWQTFQILQAGHFLWPPFLFGSLYRRGRKAVASQFGVLVSNLPYYEG
jgi:hypothetical protein